MLAYLTDHWATVPEVLVYLYKAIPRDAPWQLMCMLGQVLTHLDRLARLGQVEERVGPDGPRFRTVASSKEVGMDNAPAL